MNLYDRTLREIRRCTTPFQRSGTTCWRFSSTTMPTSRWLTTTASMRYITRLYEEIQGTVTFTENINLRFIGPRWRLDPSIHRPFLCAHFLRRIHESIKRQVLVSDKVYIIISGLKSIRHRIASRWFLLLWFLTCLLLRQLNRCGSKTKFFSLLCIIHHCHKAPR